VNVFMHGVTRALARSADLGLLVLCAGLLVGLMLLDTRQPAVAVSRLVLGVVVVLFAPGYCLVALLVPRRAALDQAERIGISIGASVALIPLMALLLDALPGGLRPWPVVVAESVWIAGCALAAVWQRAQAPEDSVRVSVGTPGLFSVRRWLRRLSWPERIAYPAILAVVVVASGLSLGTLLLPTHDDLMTEMYVLGRGGLAEQLPRQVTTGEPVSVTLGVVNRELSRQTYRFEAWTTDAWSPQQRAALVAPMSLSLVPGEQIEWPLTWAMAQPGDDQVVDLLLYLDGRPQPYRRLRLWLDVQPAPAMAGASQRAGQGTPVSGQQQAGDLASGIEADLAPPGPRPTLIPMPQEHLPLSVPVPVTAGSGTQPTAAQQPAATTPTSTSMPAANQGTP
jgi:uncharacterized membrane protein